MTSGVVSIINESIKQALDCKVQGGAVYGIAEQTIRQSDNIQQVFPTVYDNDGHGKDVTVDDTYPFIVYHRLLNKNYSYPQIKSFGNPKEYIQETAEYVCVVYAKRSYLKMTAEQVETLVKVSIPATLTNPQLQQLQLKSAVIQHNSSVLDTQTNYNSEYRGIESRLGSEEVFITLRYTIETVFKKDCLNLLCVQTTQPPTIHLFATETNVDTGTEIELSWIATNVNKVFIDGIGWLNGAFGFINVTIDNTITYNGTATNSAGTATDSITITVGNACDDATAVLKDTANNTISTTNIASGDSEDIIAPDGHVVLKKENDGVITNLFPRSGQTIQYQVDDSLITLKDTANNTILTESVHATENETIVAPNATVQLKDTAGNNIGSADSYRSNSSNNKTAPDGSITNSNSDDSYVNTVIVRSGQLLKANELPDINLIVNDQNGNNLLNVNRPSVKNLTEVVTVVTALVVDFSVNDSTPDTNQTITFTDLTVGATQWQWDFGDGNTSTLQNPTHTYKYAGSYTVTLCATNGSISGKEVKTNYIAVTLQTIPTTTLQAWYKAPVGATPSNLTLVSGAISQWNDESGNGYNLAQGTPANRPTYSATEITSPDGTVYGGGTFDGTNDFLSNVSAGFTRGTTSTMFMLFRQISIASGSRIVFGCQGALQFISTLANNPQFRMNSGGNIDTLIAYPLANYFVVKFQYSNAGNASIKINDLIARALSNTGASTDVGIVIGGNISGTAQSNITFVEGAIYSTALSAPNETSILNYFASKFGLW